MKPAIASALAMTIAWALPLVATALGQLATSGRTADIAVSAIWIGFFTFLAWAAIVLPVLRVCPSARWFHDLRWSWLGWAALAAGSYSLLVASWAGFDMLAVGWYPAVMGAIAGAVFAWLTRKHRPAPGGSVGVLDKLSSP